MFNTATIAADIRNVQKLQQELLTSTHPISVVQSAIEQIHSLHCLVAADLSDADLHTYELSRSSLNELVQKIMQLQMVTDSVVLMPMCRSVDDSPTAQEQELINAVFQTKLAPEANNAISKCIHFFFSQLEQEKDRITKLLFLLCRATGSDGDIMDAVTHFMKSYAVKDMSMEMRPLFIDWIYKLATKQTNNSITTLMTLSLHALFCEDHETLLTDFYDLITSDMSDEQLRFVLHKFMFVGPQHHEMYCSAKSLLSEYPDWHVDKVIHLLSKIWHHTKRDRILEQTRLLIRNVRDQGVAALAVVNVLGSIWNDTELEEFIHCVEQLSAKISTNPHETFSTFHYTDRNPLSIIHMLSAVRPGQRNDIVFYALSVLPNLVTSEELAQTLSAVCNLIGCPRLGVAWACLLCHLYGDLNINDRISILTALALALQNAAPNADIPTLVDECINNVRDQVVLSFPLK